MTINKVSWAPVLLAFAAVTSVRAQGPAPSMECDNNWRGWRQRDAHVCEVRELTVVATGSLSVDAGPNGGVQVTGWGRDEVRVRAVVRAWAEDEDDALAVANEVRIRTADIVRADGPDNGRRRSWSVSYEIFAPRTTDLRVETRNGGIAITDVRGNIDFETTNGGIKLDGVAGNVRGHTTNGGVDVALAGDTWEGDALDVSTTNGGVKLRVPEGYSARLEAGTVNGGVSIDFPVTVQGRIGRNVSTTLGNGGPLMRARTTNGGVRVSRR
jgi:hypothetical protein